MTDDLSRGEQRKRAGLDSKGRVVRRGKPRSQDEIQVDGVTYPVVGREERVDLTPAQVERRREKFVTERRSLHRMLKRKRADQPLHQRLETVLTTIRALQTPRARSIQPAEHDAGRDQPVLPPGGDELALSSAHRNDVTRMLRMIDRAVEKLEDLIDAHKGLGPLKDYQEMDTYDKNAVILSDFMGWDFRDVAAFEPALGTARTIRYVREKWAADPKNRWPGGPYRGVCGHEPGKCTSECPPVPKKRAPRP
jgi:hypothetical protein